MADALGGCVSFYEYMTQLRGGSDGLRDPMARLLLRLHDDDPDRLEALVDAVNGLPQGGVMVRGELRDADPFAAGAAVAQSGDLANWR